MYRKRKLIQLRITGPARLMIGLPAGYCVQTIPITTGSDLLFEWKHVLFYTEGMNVEGRVQTFKNAIITRELVKMKFTAEAGTLAILSNGPLYRMELASQHMNYHWELTGRIVKRFLREVLPFGGVFIK